MSRLPQLDPATLSLEQKAIYDAIASGPRKGVRGPLAVWLRRPELAKHAQALGKFCRYDTSLDPRLSELVILLMGRHWLAEYEWAAHKPFALQAGLSPGIIDAIRDGRTPEFKNRDEAVIYTFVRQLHDTRDVDDALYAEAVKLFGEDGVVELAGIIGYYSLISVTIKIFRLPPHAGGEPELPTTLDK